MAASTAQYKKEKKVIEEKLQKVRQVVPTVSNNDIILALHNYDLNVERTIQAFLEEGSQGALGDWENTTKTKKSKKKAATQNGGNNSSTSSVKDSTTGTFKQNGKSISSSTTSNGNNGHINGYTNGVTAVAASSSAVKSKQAPQITTTTKLDNLDRLNSAEKSKVLSTELNALNRHETDLTNVQRQFETEVSRAENYIVQCFKEIRQVAVERERQLLAALSGVRSEGHQYLSSRHSQLEHLKASANAPHHDENVVVNELKNFLANKHHDLELGQATRFVYDNSKLVNSIARFGEIVAISGTVVPTPMAHSNPSQSQDMKNATSHSSLVSSVGEDSGLGQISPIATEKNVAHVDNGGIVMKSNAISADQLAEIQRQLAEQLKAQGIDPSVLSGAGTVAPRGPQPRRVRVAQDQNKSNNKKGGNKNPDISILKK